ncbi:MAG: hypothetical protein ABIP94_17580 [Planctomycetota bacterium]
MRVSAGSYREFTCNKGLTIAAVPSAQVDIVRPFFSMVANTIFQIPPVRTARAGRHGRVRVRELHGPPCPT